MLYVDAIRILEKIAQARFLHATMPKQEEIEEAIKVVASQVTVAAFLNDMVAEIIDALEL